MKYLVMASSWIGADCIVEAESAEAAGKKWVEGKASPTPGEITIYALGEPERFTVKIEQVSVKPAEAPKSTGTYACCEGAAAGREHSRGCGMSPEWLELGGPPPLTPEEQRTPRSINTDCNCGAAPGNAHAFSCNIYGPRSS